MKNKPKVMFLVNIPSPYRVNFFNELGRLCDLTVLFEHKFSFEREKSWHDYNFKNFKGIFLDGINITRNLSLTLGFIKFIKNRKYDHIIIGGYSTLIGMLAINYLNIKRIPFILNIDGGMIKKENKFKKKIKQYYISSASFYLSTGEIGSNYLEYYGATRKKIFTYPFTTLYKKDILVDPISNYKKRKLRKQLGMRNNKIVISVGQFIYRKGFDVLIKAWGSVKSNASLYFIGGEPSEEYLELVKGQEISNIHFIGFKSKSDLQKYYQAADLFVLPTREDIWGLVINEAMANGLPVITTDKCVAGLELINNNENGYIIPVDDDKILSKKIEIILNNQVLLKKMSKQSLDISKKYTIENMATRILKILQIIEKERKYDK